MSQATASPISGERYLTHRQLQAIVPGTKMTHFRWVRAGQFPPPVRIGGQNFWRLSEVQDFLANRPQGYSRPAYGAVANLKARKAATSTPSVEAQAK